MSEEQKNFLDLILPLNIEARYPTQKIEGPSVFLDSISE